MGITDAHCHTASGESRSFLCSPFALPTPPNAVLFYGTHPWYLDGFDADQLKASLAADPSAGVGEIGLDRLKDRAISPKMRQIFETQLEIAAEMGSPVVLHGAKCWGEVVKTCKPYAGRIPAFLFHGFSRSDGLIPDIVAINGYISVGPALLNDHAVNYRELAKRIPLDRLLVESDRTPENADTVPPVDEIAAFLATLRGMPLDALAAALESNAARFTATMEIMKE